MSLANKYYVWLLDLVHLFPDNSHSTLLKKLHNTEFIFSHPMDENRLINGISMRYKFGYAHGYSEDYISENLSVTPCSLLEMMVSLACEQEVILNVEFGVDRIDIWFSTMLQSLGLDKINNDDYDEEYVNRVISNLYLKTYSPDGRGGLFYIPNCPVDLRRVDIWTQMLHYIEYCNIK